MIFLKNSIEGFNLIVGGFLQHLILMLALIICVRPPSYEDEQRTKEAKYVYIFLIFYHLALGVSRYWSLFISNKLRATITMIMLASVVVTILLCQRWIYVDLEAELELKTKKQIDWYVWCWIELAFFYSTMFGAAIFTMIRSLLPVVLRV
jgi:hypothetical protein